MIGLLLERVRHRAAGESVLDAVRVRALELADVLAAVPHGPARGGMPYLTATSPLLGRALNDLFVRNAEQLAGVLAEERGLAADDLAVRAEALALLAPSHAFLTDIGRRAARGESTADAARALRPSLEEAFARLGAGLARS
jgi:hypothetical protein